MRSLPVALLLCLAPVVFAAPNVTSITPASGRVQGGQEVTIHGSGFINYCPPIDPCIAQPPAVFFGSEMSPQTRYVNETTVIAVTPKHLPGMTAVRVVQPDGESTLARGFTFEGDPLAAFHRYLLPTYTPPVRGANGSEFHTELTLLPHGDTPRVQFFGLEVLCFGGCAGSSGIDYPLQMQSGEETPELRFTGNPGRFFYVPVEQSFTANLRVFDVTRDAQNYGTELPIVHQRAFSKDTIYLPAVPASPRFRNTLRIYNADVLGIDLLIEIGDRQHKLSVPGMTNVFQPGYAVFTDFPTSGGPYTVVIHQLQMPISVDMTVPLWAFITVTNNDTQLITTITPQP